MTTRAALHEIVDELADDEVPRAQAYLGSLRRREEDPFRMEVLDLAPVDDEPLTDEDLIAVSEALEENARGDVVAHADVRRALRDVR